MINLWGIKMKKLNITKEAFEKSKYFKNKYGKLEYVSESGKVFKTNKGKVLMFKESSTDDLYDFYEWLKSNTELDSGIHVKFHDNEDGSGSIEMTFNDRYEWDDDVEDGNLPKEEDSGVKDWIAQFERKAVNNGWELDTDEDGDEFYLILSASDEGGEGSYQEGTESNPRFKCMEGRNEYVDDIREFRDDVVSALKKCYGDEYIVEPDMMNEKSIVVSDPYSGLDYKIDISVSDEVEM
jgi:hypothetical protein